MTPEEALRTASPLTIGALAAMKRAALAARETARQTGTAIAVMVNGEIRHLSGDDLLPPEERPTPPTVNS